MERSMFRNYSVATHIGIRKVFASMVLSHVALCLVAFSSSGLVYAAGAMASSQHESVLFQPFEEIYVQFKKDDKFLKFSFFVDVSGNDVIPYMKANYAEIKESTIKMTIKMGAKYLNTTEGKAELKKRILEKLNRDLEKNSLQGRVNNVLIDTFILI